MENAIAANDNSRASNTTAAQDIRAALKVAFPGVKFSVRKESYTCVRVAWTDGPAYRDVANVAEQWQAGHFDGMTDSYVYDKTRKPNAVRFVSCDRDISAELQARVRADLLAAWAVDPGYELDTAVYRVLRQADLRRPYLGVQVVDGQFAAKLGGEEQRDLLAELQS